MLVLCLTGPEERLARAAFFWGVAAAHLGLGLALLARARRAATALLAVAVAFAVVGVTFPLPGAGSTLCWAGLATLLVGAGFARQSGLTRSLGLGLFAATVLKVALWDLWRLGRAWQVSVLLGVGALLMLASYFYARRGSRPREAPAERPVEPAAPHEASGGWIRRRRTSAGSGWCSSDADAAGGAGRPLVEGDGVFVDGDAGLI